VKTSTRGQELLDAGAFTVADFAKRSGWTHDKATSFLVRAKLRHEYANDPRLARARRVKFYFHPF